MLYDFHHGQNARKPGSVHATYIVDGKPRKLQEVGLNEDSRNGEDEHMQSSPFMSSSMPQEGAEEDTLPVRKITLAREEDLEGRRSNEIVNPRSLDMLKTDLMPMATSRQKRFRAHLLHTYLQFGGQSDKGLCSILIQIMSCVQLSDRQRISKYCQIVIVPYSKSTQARILL